MKVTTEDCVKSIVNYLIEKEHNFTDAKDWKRISKTGTGDNIIRKFQNNVSNRVFYVKSSVSEIFEVSDKEFGMITKFDNFKKIDDNTENSDDRVFVTSYGRDMFKETADSFINHTNISSIDRKNEIKDNYGFRIGDIISITSAFPIGEAQIVKLKYDEYGGACSFKVTAPSQNSFTKKGKIENYAASVLYYAILVTPVTSDTIIPKIKKEKSKKSKYILEVEDFSVSNIDWQKEAYNDENINIGITVYVKGEDYMYDDEVLAELPELEDLNLGEIQTDDNGFVGLDSSLSITEIKQKLINNGFKVK